MELVVSQIVIVVDVSNYKYSETVPFKATFIRSTDYPVYWVKSIETGNEYELYDNQILELNSREEIETLIDINKYGL